MERKHSQALLDAQASQETARVASRLALTAPQAQAAEAEPESRQDLSGQRPVETGVKRSLDGRPHVSGLGRARSPTSIDSLERKYLRLNLAPSLGPKPNLAPRRPCPSASAGVQGHGERRPSGPEPEQGAKHAEVCGLVLF